MACKTTARSPTGVPELQQVFCSRVPDFILLLLGTAFSTISTTATASTTARQMERWDNIPELLLTSGRLSSLWVSVICWKQEGS